MGILVHRNNLPILCTFIKGKCGAQYIILLYSFPPLEYCTGSGALCPSEINSKGCWNGWEKYIATRG